MKNYNLAFLLSLLFPGIGQLYNYQYRKGCKFILATFSILAFLPILSSFGGGFFLFLHFLVLALLIWSLIDAVFVARKTEKSTEVKFDKFYHYFLGIILSWVITYGVFFSLGKYLYGSWRYRISLDIMAPVIKTGDTIIAQPNYFKYRDLESNIVVMYRDGRGFLKIGTIVGKPGDSIEPSMYEVKVNGTKVYETMILSDQKGLMVPKDMVYIVNEMPSYSMMDGEFGLIHKDKILGKLLYVAYSDDFSRWGKRITSLRDN